MGDTDRLEGVVELVSSQAVKLDPGAHATLSGWGGDDLAARVARIAPVGRTASSALGVEEQRVDVIVRPRAGTSFPAELGHGYRLHAELVLWRSESTLRLPVGALVRSTGGAWAVYAVRNDRAVRTPVELGRRGTTQAQVTAGLAPGTQVIVYPGDGVTDGVAIEPRDGGA